MVPGLEWNSFVQKWEQMDSSGYRLVDIETHMHQGKRFFAGVFHEASGGHALQHSTWASFIEAYDALTADGLRLIDFETYVVGETRLYLGVYRPGSSGYALVAGHTWESFMTEWSERSAEGHRLVDVEYYSGLGDAPSARSWLKESIPLTAIPHTTPWQTEPPEWTDPRVEPTSFPAAPPVLFVRGDADSDLSVELSDAMAVLETRFHGADKIECFDAADANDDGFVDVTDAVTILDFLFMGGAAPAGGPAGEPQTDGTPDGLDCAKPLPEPEPQPAPRAPPAPRQTSKTT